MPLPARDEIIRELAEEGLVVRGGVRGGEAMLALIESWRNRHEFGLTDREAILEATRLASDREFAKLATDTAVVAGKPVAAAVVTGRGGNRYVVLRFRSGLTVRWRPPASFWQMRVTQRHRIIYDVLVAELRQRGKTWFVTRLQPLRVAADPEGLKKYADIVLSYLPGDLAAAGLNEHGFLAATFLGFPSSREAYRVMAIRMALMSASPERPVHVAEIGTLGTLKSTTAMLFETFDDAWRLTEWPTVATLFGDARTGYTRLTATRLLVFDEVTKWRRKTGDSYDIWSGVANGMATCTWRRAAGGARAPGVDKCVSTYWMGNPDAVRPVTGDGVVPPFEHLRKWLQDVAGLDGENLRSIMSRMGAWGSYVGDAVAQDMVKSIHKHVPRPGVFKAWAEETRRRAAGADPEPPPGLEGDARVVERFEAAARYLRAVFLDEAEADRVAAEIARGLHVESGGAQR